MLFNSFAFLVFFPIVYILFFSTRGTVRHLVLLFASCVFYAWFIPKYLLILFVTILIDYYAAIKIENSKTDKERKIHLLIGVINTCAVLFIFKYHNFFVDTLNLAGFSFVRWDILLPIGLSFHTFQSLSYVIDVYRKKIPAERNLLIYSNFVMMFPQLVAGPIERGAHLLPQLRSNIRTAPDVHDFAIGSTLFMYGLFKKLVVADNIGPYVSAVYATSGHHSGMTLLVASMLFAIQIYADFSGYSDMAIGAARMLGYRFNDNFQTPYFSTSITEFWRRWHISLSSWLRDYLYYPLVFAIGKTKGRIALSILITFSLIGLWHGANWTYVLFGALHGMYLVIELLTESARRKILSFVSGLWFEKIVSLCGRLYVFILVSLSFVFFRSTDVAQAFSIFKKIFTDLHLHEMSFLDTNGFAMITLSVCMLYVLEVYIFTKYSIEDLYVRKRGALITGAFTSLMILLVLSCAWWGEISFIYFQF